MEYTGQIWGIWAGPVHRPLHPRMCMGRHQVVIWSRRRAKTSRWFW